MTGPGSSEGSGPDARWLVASLLAFLFVDLLAPFLPGLGRGAQLAYITVLSIPAMTLPVYLGARPWLHARALPTPVVPATAVALVALLLGDHGTTATVAKLLGATIAGGVLAGRVGSRSLLVTAAVAVACVDAYSVADGPTRTLVLREPVVLDDLALNLQVPDSHLVDQIGTSDLLFFSFFVASCWRFGLRRFPTWLAMTASLSGSLLLADAWGNAVPALPLLSTAFLAVNFDRLRSAYGRTPRPGAGGSDGGSGAR